MKQVLLVEDDRDLRQVCADTLKELGYDVVEAADGVEAIEQLRRVRPAGMILDLRLPVKSGYEVLREVRESPTLASLPVIVISGAATGKWSLRVGADAYLAKPFDLHELTGTMRRVIH
jgi:DNA-binding response OmpR family regulator